MCSKKRRHMRQQGCYHAGRQIMAHAVDAYHARAGNALGRVQAAGIGHQRVGFAMQHQGGAAQAVQLIGALRVGCDGGHLAHTACGVVAALDASVDACAQLGRVLAKAGAADGAQHVFIVRYDRCTVFACGLGHECAQHRGLCLRQPARRWYS